MIVLVGGVGVWWDPEPFPGLLVALFLTLLHCKDVTHTRLPQHLSERVLPSLALLGRGSCWPPNEPDIN